MVMDNVEFSPKVPPAGDVMFTTGTWSDGSTYYLYEDPLLHLDGRLTNTRFSFTLTNRHTDSLRIHWADAFYIDQHGDSLRVIHNGVDFASRFGPQAPGVLAPGAKQEDFLLPVTNIKDEATNYSLWKILYLFYDKEQNVGQKVSFLLPVSYGNVERNYRFFFTINAWNI